MPNRSLPARVGLWLPALVYMAIIFGFSSASNPMPALTSHIWDKLLHLTEYGGLAFLLCRALAGEGLSWTTAIVIAAALTSAYGVSDEIHQIFVPLRSPDVHDWFADTIGAVLGAVAFRAVSMP